MFIVEKGKPNIFFKLNGSAQDYLVFRNFRFSLPTNPRYEGTPIPDSHTSWYEGTPIPDASDKIGQKP